MSAAGDIVRRFLNYPHPIRYYLYRRARGWLQLDPPLSYHERIRSGQVDRPYYGYCLYEAARLAKALGHPRVSVIEFGVAGGNGLVNLEMHAEAVTAELGVGFDVYGFDIETGLPPSSDYRDAPYGWGAGFYPMDRPALEARLKRARLVIGNVADTVPRFIAEHQPAPIGAVMFDLDQYTSTRHALSLFDADSRHYLPRVQCSFDDTNTIEFVGELAAIREFNDGHPAKKIGKIFAGRAGWLQGGEKIYEFHDFAHPDYLRPVSQQGEGRMPLHG